MGIDGGRQTMTNKFQHDCTDCGDEYETFHAYESYRCPGCIGN